MRAELSTIQQTLTPEAASVLNHSIAEAGRRNHGQTTPLHVAATLLASPSGFLRQACIRSHPNSSHPLQCRALELCFSVALERLPTAAIPVAEPPISNALMAALKRAQAHQRRGCPEQQQQPLLAIKVELEQLIISILDDPSVSRVMREASFSSPAVKATIEHSLNNNSSNPPPQTNSTPIGLGFRPVPAPANRNLYLNPRLQQNASVQSGQHRSDDVKRVVDILGRAKKRNPVLVGDSEPNRKISEILKKIENKEFQNGPLKNAQVIRLDELNPDKAARIEELGGLIETRIGNSGPCGGGGVILDLGDLKWCVEKNTALGATQPQTAAADVGRAAVAELRKLLERFQGSLWFIGTATSETFLRCQVYHPSMENDWDLQVVPVASKAPLTGNFPRIGNNGKLGTPVEPFSPLKSFPSMNRQVYEKVDPSRGLMNCCLQCLQNYEQEASKLEKSSSEVKTETAQLKQLPQWLQNAKASNGDVKPVDPLASTKIQELQKKWNETCLRLHPSYHHKPSLTSSERIVPRPISITTSFCNRSPLLCQPLHPKLQPDRKLFDTVQLNSNPRTNQTTEQVKGPPRSPVRTELVLGRSKVVEPNPEKIQDERVKDFLGCISSQEQTNKTNLLQSGKLGNSLDIDLFKRLLKGLSEKVWWQHDAASAVAATVSQCKLGNGKRRGVSSKGDVWLLFSGPDRVGKKKMASYLSELAYGNSPIAINLGSRRDDKEANLSFRGKTALDRIAETVRKSPFSVIILEDIDEADMLLCGSIKRAMERGRLCDSHGREISLGNVIFILTANWTTRNSKTRDFSLDERKVCGLVSGSWGLRLCLSEKSSKRRPSWLYSEEVRLMKARKDNDVGLSFDLNEAADVADDDKADMSHNSSDLTIDHDQEENVVSNKLSLQYVPFMFHELVSCVDDAIVFKPVDFSRIRQNIRNLLSKRFGDIIGDSLSFEIKEDALEKIVGGMWIGQEGLEEWIEGAIVPGLNQLKSRLSSRTHDDDRRVAQLELDDDDDGDSDDQRQRDLLPSSIKLVVE